MTASGSLRRLALGVNPDFKIVKGAYPFIADFVLGSKSTTIAKNLRQLMRRVRRFVHCVGLALG